MPCEEHLYEFRYARHPRTCVFILQAVSNYFLHSFLIMTIELGWCTNLSQSTIHVQKLDFISPLHLGQCPQVQHRTCEFLNTKRVLLQKNVVNLHLLVESALAQINTDFLTSVNEPCLYFSIALRQIKPFPSRSKAVTFKKSRGFPCQKKE